MLKVRISLALLLVAVLISWGGVSSNAAPSDDQAGQWYYDRFASPKEASHYNINALSLDGAGNGWLATIVSGGGKMMMQLTKGQLSDGQFAFSGMAVEDMVMAEDGSSGWAIGFDSDNQAGNPATKLLRYADGGWSDASASIVARGMHYKFALSRDAKNGWAAGIHQVDGHPVTTLLHLVDGKWQDDTNTVSGALIFTAIATDPAAQQVWAAAYVRDFAKGPTLYRLHDGKWSAPDAAQHYVIQSLAVDDSGNGWALPNTDHQFDDSLVTDSLIRFHADGTTTLVKNTLIADSKVRLTQLALDGAGNGWVLGSSERGANLPPLTVMIRLQGDSATNWQYAGAQDVEGAQTYPIFGLPKYLAIRGGAAWAALDGGKLIHFGTLPFAAPAPAAEFGANIKNQCFDNSYCLYDMGFLSFWQTHGGLAQFGLPVTEPLYERLDDGKIYLVQYTERARFELHPENLPSSRVLLGLLGNKLAAGREAEQPFQPAQAGDGGVYFKETSHNSTGVIYTYWQQHGGLAVFGYPISEAFQEKSATDGKMYLVQYFERNRLEGHPENGDPNYQVLLGLLGVQQFQATYGNKP